MNESVMFQNTAIVDIDEELKKQEELYNTIRMEPIIEKTVIVEEPIIKKKKKLINITDYILMTMIFTLSVIFTMVIFKVF